MTQKYKNATQSDWLKACKRLGLKVDRSKGKGSHARVYRDDPPAALTIQKSNLNPITNKKILKNLLSLGFTETEIENALK